MSSNPQVTRLRVSHLHIHIHDRMNIIGQPQAFSRLLRNPAPVAGFEVTLPFGPGLAIDNEFWALIADGRMPTVPATDTAASKLRTAGVPLRCSGTLDVPSGYIPRIEAHLRPFGVVATTTVDLVWTDPMPLEQVPAHVQALERTQAAAAIGPVRWSGDLAEASAGIAAHIVGRLSEPDTGYSLTLPTHRLVTIISGAGVAAGTVPSANSSIHSALHRLSAGQDILADPTIALVPLWSNAGYAVSAAKLFYLLDQGSALLSADMIPASSGAGGGTSRAHRLVFLLLTHVLASIGLLRAAQSSKSVLMREWGRTAAAQIGRLFGPASAYRTWGLITRALVQRLGATQEINAYLPTPLRPNPDFPELPTGTPGQSLP
ncbi:hypothetical protein AB0G02_18875 [Actinosynnema sp. NPDC023658]|uniref:hypothetical protein n=1 Tax=Actinosynnema sp. NPDC023658 TaxID=3155465 RepID=UPI003410DBD3